ncbi:Rpp14/Pop5 family protein [Halolamina salifodinae]|uniref:Ribonuclease P protein component 2 n=1 Tax=Halolamina salifodinae TaxID=1202767 RepID=A0A8T4GVQ0_9EURY|nr:Rpp14/Pop5 family protein [Halolamina salifodinae]MBP1987087.1 ribonuclease P/MRP protein subunit POP5 [Halolamina salifodinae]
MKHLPKHLQPRWRYLAVAVETWPDADIGRRAFQRELWYAGQNLLGDPGSADADLRLLRYDVAEGTGGAIVRVRRGEVEAARAALACVDEVNGHPIGLRLTGVSGSVDAASESYLGDPAGSSTQEEVTFEGADHPAHRRDGAVDVETPTGWLGATVHDCE